ncbi:MAG: VOC family protein [Eubacteriales bacterium]
MKFCWCTIQVKDMEESLTFYQEIVGLPLTKRFRGGDVVEIAFLGNEPTKVELICNTKQPPEGSGKGISLGFEVGNLDDAMQSINEKGIKIEGGPFAPNPQTRFFYIKDPNGVKVQFVENK